MPRKRELTWQAGTKGRPGRWKRVYKGRTVYCGTASAKGDLEAYKMALEVWEQEKSRIDAEIASQPKPNQPNYEDAIQEWEKILQWSQAHNSPAHAALAREKLAELRKRLEQPSPSPLAHGDRFWDIFELPKVMLDSIGSFINHAGNPPPPDLSHPGVVDPSKLRGLGSPNETQREIWRDRLNVQDDNPIEQENTVEAQLNRFLDQERLRVDSKRLSASRFTSKRNNLYRFRDWVGSQTPIDALTGTLIQGFHQELLRQIKAGTLAQDTAHDRLGDAKGFIRWLWRMEILPEMPRVMEKGSNELSIGKRISTPEVFTIAEIQSLIQEASDRPRLFILLMLNCGMYQSDISDILQDEVDWEVGTITRKRSKTNRHASVPIVRYKLWGNTLKLLQENRAASGERVLVNATGGPLVLRGLKPNGDPLTNDAIKNAIDRVRRKLKIPKPLKLFRKTSATLIRGNPEFRGLEDLFLGLSPTSISDRHYAQAPDELLAKATAWLATQYGVE